MAHSRWSRRRLTLRRGRGHELLLVRLRQRRAPGHLRAEHVGGGRAESVRAKAISSRRRRRIFASSTSGTRAAMRSIGTRGTGRFKTSGSKRSGDGPLVLVLRFLGLRPRRLFRPLHRQWIHFRARARRLASFFWRQVVAKSPEDATPSLAYERGWNAINELVRSDNSWHGYARNVMFVNNRDGTFTEVRARLDGLSWRTAARLRWRTSIMTGGWK